MVVAVSQDWHLHERVDGQESLALAVLERAQVQQLDIGLHAQLCQTPPARLRQG